MMEKHLYFTLEILFSQLLDVFQRQLRTAPLLPFDFLLGFSQVFVLHIFRHLQILQGNFVILDNLRHNILLRSDDLLTTPYHDLFVILVLPISFEPLEDQTVQFVLKELPFQDCVGVNILFSSD